ncbi:MAG: caspase family protein [Cyanobacteria bacterium REEB459]|nr:caspase family protein [Cyanobacteria bacterium REEB459]
MSRDALVVGINHYQTLPALRAAAADAEAVARCLESFGDCRVFRLPEAIRDQKPVINPQAGVTAVMLEAALIRLFKPTGKTIPETAIFYYSGHGLQRHAGIQEGYLATSDANPATGHYGLSLYWLRRLLQESPVRQRVLLLDCCNSGELFNILEADPGARAGTDRLFMAACREYEPAYEALDGRHSVFTQALLTGLNPHIAEGGLVNSHALTNAVNRSLKGELQQPLFESSGTEIVLTRVAGVGAVTPATLPSTLDRLKHLSYSLCPFQGLAPFDVGHSPFFFGREDLVDTLVEQVQQSRFCALVGASGIGKTSILQAGLMARLQASAEPSWDIRYLTPGSTPWHRLAEVFVDARASGLDRATQMRQAEALLNQGGAGLCQLLQAMTASNSRVSTKPRSLLLVIDQLEELWGPSLSVEQAQQRQQLLEAIVTVVNQPDLAVHVVVGLRADYLSQLEGVPALADLVRQHRLMVKAMGYEQIKSTIVGPLEKIGLHYDANLIYTLLLDVVGAPGDLALLQMALQEIWRSRQCDPTGQQPPRLTLDAYANLGGIRQLLSQRAHQLYETLTPVDRQAARRIFLSLCDFGDGTSLSRRQVQLPELITPQLDQAQILSTLEKLIAARLVIAQPQVSQISSDQASLLTLLPAWTDNQGDYLGAKGSNPPTRDAEGLDQWTLPAHFDIAHESLIRTWPLLQEWVQQDRSLLGQQRTLEVAAQQWQRQNQGDRWGYFLPPNRLAAAKRFQITYPDRVSTQVIAYLQDWELYCRQCTRKRQLMKLLVPISLAAGMVVTYGYTLIRHSFSSWPLGQPTPASQIAPGQLPSPIPRRPSPTAGQTPNPTRARAPGKNIPFSPRPVTLSPTPPSQSNRGPTAALGRLDKVAEWADPSRPNNLIQVWCGHSHPQPLCLTLSTERSTKSNAAVQP